MKVSSGAWYRARVVLLARNFAGPSFSSGEIKGKNDREKREGRAGLRTVGERGDQFGRLSVHSDRQKTRRTNARNNFVNARLPLFRRIAATATRSPRRVLTFSRLRLPPPRLPSARRLPPHRPRSFVNARNVIFLPGGARVSSPAGRRSAGKDNEPRESLFFVGG